MEWISVKDRLPEKELNYASVDCLFATGKRVLFGYLLYSREQWCEPSNGDYYDNDMVTHWMPLPKPPEKVDKPTGMV